MSTTPEPPQWLTVLTGDVHGMLSPTAPRSGPLDRLPAALKDRISAFGWQCSTETAGLWVEWETDATELFVKWTLTNPYKQAPGENRYAAAGFDCYGQDERGRWRFVGLADYTNAPNCKVPLNQAPLDGRWRRYRAYLPLSSALTSVAIGWRGGQQARLIAPDSRPPIIIYGTSIVHGCFPSRPGMAFPAQLGRHFATPVWNLGLAGSALLEPEIADVMASNRAACYVIDTLANDELPLVKERYLPFVRRLLDAPGNPPILLVNMPLQSDHAFCPSQRAHDNRKNTIWRQAIAPLLGEAPERIFLLDGLTMFGEDSDGTVDPIHPSDLGMFRMAEIYKDSLRRILGVNA